MSRYIETSEATAVIADYFDLICDTEYRFNESDILRRLNNSAVDAVPVRHGKWIDGHCSICGCDVPAYIIDWKWQKDMNARFCPMCGARMDGE